MRAAPPADPSPAAQEPRLRSFVAIELAAPARPAVEDYLARLRRGGADVAWTRPENLHLTLKFLGDVEPARLALLNARLAAVAAAQPPFVLSVCGIGGFPAPARTRVLWVGVQAPALARLAAEVDRVCAAEGFALERRPFHPHVTLGRLRQGGSRARARDAAAVFSACCAADRELAFGESPAEALVLYRSELGPRGARHEPLARLALGG